MRRAYRQNKPIPKGPGLLLDIPLNNLEIGLQDLSIYAHPLIATDVTGQTMINTPNGSFIGFKSGPGVKAKWNLGGKTIFPLSVSYWVYRMSENIHGHGWFSEFRNAADTGWIFGHGLTYQGRNQFYGANGLGGSCMPTTIQAQAWTHIVTTYTNSGLFVYFNSNIVQTQNITISSAACSVFGLRYADGDESSNPIDIAFRELKIYEKALTQEEVVAIYTAEKFLI